MPKEETTTDEQQQADRAAATAVDWGEAKRLFNQIASMDEKQLAELVPEVADRPAAHFESLVRRAAEAAAQTYIERREPIPMLVQSAQNAGLSKPAAQERASGDQISEPRRRMKAVKCKPGGRPFRRAASNPSTPHNSLHTPSI